MELDSTKVKRLSFIKYLYKIGISQSNKSEQLASAALLTFHDAAELFLQLASEHLDEGKSGIHFMEYWKKLNTVLPDNTEVTQKESMRRLNNARVALKHHGTRPSKIDLEGFRAAITNFFQDNCPILFGISFDSISMIDFVEPEEARKKLHKAEKLNSDGNIDKALDEIVKAFEIMLNDYEKRKTDIYNQSPFFFGKNIRRLNPGVSRHSGDKGRFLHNVRESIDAMQEAIKILALGIDYKKYSRFKVLTPNALMTLGGEYVIQRGDHLPREEANKKDVEFCIDFTIESALKLKEFDYEIDNNI